MGFFTKEQLEAKTTKELKRMCVHELNIPGMTKKTKNVVIDAILESYSPAPTSDTVTTSIAKDDKMSAVAFTGHSVITKPDQPFGERTTTTLQVSCGASSGSFPVIGRTVKQVGEFLREVLNVDQLSTGIVNGKEVSGDYILNQGDNLEFLKPAGKKGC